MNRVSGEEKGGRRRVLCFVRTKDLKKNLKKASLQRLVQYSEEDAALFIGLQSGFFKRVCGVSVCYFFFLFLLKNLVVLV